MNSRWGFDLDMSAVRLMRREGGHWREVAAEKIDGPDIEDRLTAMIDKIHSGSAVELFLPRDQILYTDVKITHEDTAQLEIAAAMDGLTPYSLSELELDWVVTDPETARVAAIAKETLDEAAAFAEARGLAVAGYSSLADSDDFPRLPIFGQGALPFPNEAEENLDEIGEDSGPTVAFTTVREPRATEILTLTNPQSAPEAPVVRVEDTTPVMQVRTRMPPLDPGRPLENAPVTPRVRTDIAAGTLSGAAATLSPGGPSIKVRARKSGPVPTTAVFLVAAILTVGIAAIVWSILPLAPGGTSTPPASATETGLATQTEPQTEVVAAPIPAPELPEPDAMVDMESIAAGEATDALPAISLAAGPTISRLTSLLPAPSGFNSGLPPKPLQTLERSPDSLAGLLSVDPVQGLDGAEDSAETTLDIYLASVERRDLAFDAIALPPSSGLGSAGLPIITAAPAGQGETGETTSVSTTETPLPDVASVSVKLDDSSESIAPTTTLRPTALAASLPSRAPRPRPGDFTADLERQRFGGRTREELARIAPKRRPQSAQIVALADRKQQAEATELAVATSLAPKGRPKDFDAIVAAAIVNARAEELTASVQFDTPDTTAAIEAALAEDAEPEPRPQDTPRLAIPSGASVSRQATIENAIPLNKINLVGVYGVPSDRRALIRLPSGRYVKVKVGDRVDGGTVAQISDSELIYQKGSRTLSLSLPKG